MEEKKRITAGIQNSLPHFAYPQYVIEKLHNILNYAYKQAR